MIKVSGELRRFFFLKPFFYLSIIFFFFFFLGGGGGVIVIFLTNHGDRIDYFRAYQMLHVTFIFAVFLNIRFVFGTWRRLKFP